jgi:hypothetical protein
MRFLISGIMLSVLWLAGCGVENKDDDPSIGSITHRDFPCISGDSVGPVIIKPSFPMQGQTSLQTVSVGTTVGQLRVWNIGKKPIRIEGPIMVMLEGVTKNQVAYKLVGLAGAQGAPYKIGEIATPNGQGILNFGSPALQDFLATIDGGEQRYIQVEIQSGTLVSGDIWQISVLKGGLLYGTAPTCAGVEEVHGLEVEGQPLVLGRVAKF